MNKILIQISVGELLDKISILEIEKGKIKNFGLSNFSLLMIKEFKKDSVIPTPVESCTSAQSLSKTKLFINLSVLKTVSDRLVPPQ